MFVVGGRFEFIVRNYLKILLARLREVSQVERYVLLLLGFGFVMRMLLARYGISALDFGAWVGWGEHLWVHGFTGFFEQVGSDRLPGGILYLLWLLAGLKNTFSWLTNEFVYKLPANVADTVIAYLVFKQVARGWGQVRGMAAAMLYAFNPFTWYVSALWGQMDAVQALVLILSIMAIFRRRCVLSAVLFSYIVLFKPHSLVIAPLFLVYLWAVRRGYLDFVRRGLVWLSAGVVSVWMQSLPFALTRLSPDRIYLVFLEPLRLVWERWVVAIDTYPLASVNAFNLWFSFGQNFKSDAALFLGFSYRVWGVILFVLFAAVLLSVLLTRRPEPTLYYTAAALLALFAFTFLTRAHERHIYPFFALYAFGLFRSRWRVSLYVVVASMALFNNAHVFMRGGSSVDGFFSTVASFAVVLLSYCLLRDFILVSGREPS